MRYTHDTWSVDLPNHWQVEESDEILAMYDPEGVGAFQVTSYFKEGGDVTAEDLLEFSEVKNPETVDLPYLKGIFKRTVEDGISGVRRHFFEGTSTPQIERRV